MEYINKDYYDYISKIDSRTSSLHDTYAKILKLLLKEGLNKPLSASAKENFFKILEIRKYELQEEEIGELENLLYYDCAFRRVFKNNSGSFSVYPNLKELPSTQDLLLYYSLGLKMSVSEAINYLTPLCKEKIAQFKKVKIENYYGSPKYLLSRTKAIYDALVLLNSRNDMKEKDLVESTLSKVNTLLNEMLTLVGLENTEETFKNFENFDYAIPISKDEYDFIQTQYVKVLELENSLVDISNELWQKYAKENNGVFLHQLTQGVVESDKMDKICTSFYSDYANFITNYLNANTGYAYPMDIRNVLEICEEDVGSWEINQEKFVESGFPENWQFDDTHLWYEVPYQSKLFTPEYIEDKILNTNHFAEIIIDNRLNKVKPLYCFYTPNATQEQIDEITKVAVCQGIEVKPLLIEKDRIKNH